MPAHETPATRAARAAGIPFRLHAYAHDPPAAAYGMEAATALGLDPARVFKTLVVECREELVCCLIPVADTLDLRALGKGAAMAPVTRAERVTGYVAGGISPLGQRRRLPTLIDDSAPAHASVFVSAGRRGLELELAPGDLAQVTLGEIRRLRR